MALDGGIRLHRRRDCRRRKLPETQATRASRPTAAIGSSLDIMEAWTSISGRDGWK